MRTSTWSEERVEQLKKLFESGLSCSQIAAELGSVTRNAVIGKLHRLGMANTRPKEVRESRVPKRKRSAPPQPRRQTMIRDVLAQRDQAIASGELDTELSALNATEFDDSVPQAQRKGVLDLARGDCRWPFGDPSTPDFYFCAAPVLPDCPYCAQHVRLAYQSTQPRVRNISPEERARRVLHGQRLAAIHRARREVAS
ncbi:GcrA cell cycle regulator [Bradyrhizobium elkanii]|nr:GcrA family cell cycle regulator [Bradyrhizobium elkanii]NWL67218.1 GcrA cell cycle regulator [Bradyrhizobium elkanii]OIM94113.1 hypothetical protein BLN97_12635 [Bradyrhizobium elkanii]